MILPEPLARFKMVRPENADEGCMVLCGASINCRGHLGWYSFFFFQDPKTGELYYGFPSEFEGREYELQTLGLLGTYEAMMWNERLCVWELTRRGANAYKKGLLPRMRRRPTHQPAVYGRPKHGQISEFPTRIRCPRCNRISVIAPPLSLLTGWHTRLPTVG